MSFFKNLFNQDNSETQNTEEIIIQEYEIVFHNYKFPCVSVYPNGSIKYSEINELIENFFPPVIRTVNDDLIFINQKTKNSLIEILKTKNIPVVSRLDTWSFILEPFLDTDFSEKTKQLCYERLEECSITKIECDKLRKKVQKMMFSYNFDSGLWDWTYLGLYDLFCASNGILASNKYKMKLEKFEVFYNEAVEIALKGVLIN